MERERVDQFLQHHNWILQEMFPTRKFSCDIVQPRKILESEVILIIPEKTQDWEILSSRLPTAVSLLFFNINM